MRRSFPRPDLCSFTPVTRPWRCCGETSTGESEWERIVAGGRKRRGRRHELGGAASQTKIEEAFQSAYPKIKVTAVAGRGSQFGPKIIAERRAGKHLVEIPSSAAGALLMQPFIPPRRSLRFSGLVLPEFWISRMVVQGRRRYLMPEESTIFAFVGNGTFVELRYNTNLVSLKEFTTDWGLAGQSQWKGKDVATDPRMNGMDTPVVFFTTIPSSALSSCDGSMARWT